LLRHDRKYSRDGVERVVPPEATIERVLPLLDEMGVTRVADVTGLDRVGIPNYTAVRPREREGTGISYYNGKGLTRAAAKAGAMMEALERHSAELCDLPVVTGTRAELERLGPTVDPAAIVEPRLRRYEPDMALDWVEGYDLLAGRPTYLPLNSVVCPYRPRPGAVQLFISHTSGLASGNTIEEAVCHGLCEVLERDSDALAAAGDVLAPMVRQLRADVGLDEPVGTGVDRGLQIARLIDLESLPARALALARRLQDAKLLVYLRDVTSQVGVASFDCVSIERRLDGRHLVYGGHGCHPDARVAVCRALTESAQSRVGIIQGGREDLVHIVRTAGPFDPTRDFAETELHPFDSVPSHEHEYVDDDIRFILDRVREARFAQAVAVDLTRPELGVPVVRVVIPGAETWMVFFSHRVRATLGPRAHRIVHQVMGQ